MSHTYIQEDLSFLLELQEQGIFLHAEKDELVCDAAPGAITENIGAYIRENKARLMALLRSMERDESLPQIIPDPEKAHEPFPLTENQEAYWLGRNDSLESGGVGVHVYYEMEFEDFDKTRFENAWAEVVRSHAMLRAVLLPEGKQRVLEETPPVKIEEEFLSARSGQDNDAILEQARQEISHMQYELFDWPQFRMKVFHLPEEEGERRQSVLMASIDMWCLDLRSLQVLLDHLADLYLGQEPEAIPEPGFRDYLITLQELHQSPIYEKALSYWQDRIKTLPAAPILPTRPQSEVQTGHFTRRSWRFPKKQWQRIRSLVREKGLTTSSVLLACYASTISKWSETKRFTLNIPRYNRLPLHDDINDIVGEFASFSLLEVDNSSRIPFEELARRIQQQMWADLEFSHVSGVRVLRDWKKSLDAAPTVMAPFVFTSEPEHSVAATPSQREPAKPLKSLSWIGALERMGAIRHLVTQTPQVWLDSQFSEIRGDLYVSWDCLDGLFVEGLPERMFEAYCDLIASLGEEKTWENTEIPLPGKEIPLREILTGPKEELPGDIPLAMLRRHAESRPQDLAVVDNQGTLSWQDVLKEVELWARKLTDLGLKPGNAVAFALPKGRKQFLASMAIHCFGGIIVPLDHESPLARIKAILEDSRAAILLTDNLSSHRFSKMSCPVIDMDAPDNLPEVADLPQPHDEALYCMIYTSGSTGTPKGVMMPLEGLLNMVQDASKRFDLDHRDTILALNPIYHDFALFDMVGAALLGAKLVFPSPERLKDPGHWLERILEWGVTIWDTVPATMTMLLDYLEGSSPTELPSLRYAILGGDWIPLDTPNRLKKFAPEATVVSIGGPTEVTVWNLLYPVERFDKKWRSIPYGYPIRNAVYHILDDKLEDCPAMVVGEMYCSGAGLTLGYMNDEEKTKKAFFTHPTKNIHMFRTGDLGRLHDNGYIEFIGRRDNQVNINGYRIELGEIETAMGRHPSVSQAVAIVKRGDNSPDNLVLWVALTPEAHPSVKELRTYLKQHVPKYMFPSAIGIAETLPLTQNNKIDRGAIADWQSPHQEEAGNLERPAKPTELLLEAAWEDLLGSTGMTLDQNFFEIGGNSIAAVRLYNKVIAGKYSGMSVASIFSFPTIRSLAAAIDAAPRMDSHLEKPVTENDRTNSATPTVPTTVTWPPVNPVPMRLPTVPATRVQQRMFYEEQRQRNHCYNLSIQVAVNAPSGSIDAKAIEEAFNAVVARHEILRTNFQEVSAADNADIRCIMQQITPQRHIDLEESEPVTGSDQQQALSAFCQEFTERPYDLEKGSLVRIALVRENDSKGHLFIGFHHIVMDGWSLTLLMQDLTLALEGKELSPPQLQQADLALWENSQAFAHAAEELLPHAAQRIPADGIPSVVTDAVSLNDTDDGPVDQCHVEEYIPQHIVNRITELSEQNGSTPFAVMCTIFGLLMADYNRSDTAQFGTYIAVRALPGLENILGSMTCPAPLIMHFDRNKPLVNAARDTMVQLSESIDVSLIPFENLVRAIAPVRRGDELPLFGTAFTFDNTPAEPMAAGGMELSPLGIRQYRTSIDLEASVSMDSVGTRVLMVFNPEKLRLAPARDFMQRFTHMLAQVAENPTLPLNALSPMTDNDMDIRQERQATKEIPSEKQNLLEYFYSIEKEAPDFTALVETISTSEGPQVAETCTLSELRLLADSMTDAMLDKGVSPGQRVALLLPRGIKLTAAMLASQQCGAAFTLLPLSLATERMNDILDASQPSLICCVGNMSQEAMLNGRDMLNLDEITPLSLDEQKAFQASGRIFSPGTDTDVCLFFTSGSEGKPKGVRLTHGNWINRLEGDWHALPYAEDEACISKALTGFIDVFCELFQPLLKKIPVYILPEGEEADVEALVNHLSHWKITRAMIVVSLTQSILEVLKNSDQKLDSLRHVMSSGERLPVGLVEEFHKLLPHCKLHNYYGSTEVSADVVSCEVRPVNGTKGTRAVPLGNAMLNNRIEVMSPAHTPLPHGMLGEIVISGPSVSPGYLSGDSNGFFEYDGLRFFAPGDIGMWTEQGELLSFGRRDRQVKIRGQRVEAGDVEQAMRRHPHVALAAALTIGEGPEMKLVACVVLKEPGGITMDALRREMRRSLSGAMLPSHFIEVASIPRTGSGKVDLLALQEDARQQIHSPEVQEMELKTATEKTMASIWETLLGHALPNIQADFFACGGHSLMAIRLVALIRNNFQISLRVRDIFDTPVFADLVELVDLLSAHTGKQPLDTHEKVEVL